MIQRITLSILILLICLATGWNAWRLIGQEHRGGARSLGGDFILTTSDNKVLDSHDLRGKYLLVYFGYSFCPDICPTELQRMTQVLEQLPERIQSRITPVFVSVDPERDTPAALKEYISYFHPNFIALTGASAQLAELAKKYGAYYQSQKTSADDKNYPVDHSSYIYFMGKDGAYISHFTGETSVDTITKTLTSIIGK